MAGRDLEFSIQGRCQNSPYDPYLRRVEERTKNGGRSGLPETQWVARGGVGWSEEGGRCPPSLPLEMPRWRIPYLAWIE